MAKIKEETKTLKEILANAGILTNTEEQYKLVLWNDDHNSFEWVIYCLTTYLNFSTDRAERAAMIVHTKGKDVVKVGSKTLLEPYKKILEERGLSVTIED